MKRTFFVLVLAACAPRVALPDVAAASDVEASLRAADEAWAQRPDEARVREALAGYRAAASRVEGLTGTVRTAAWLVEHGARADRKALVDQALQAGELCQQRAPATPPCDYWQAAALGVAARERPLSALGNVKELMDLLRRADAKAPALDHAGPARLLAIVLVRAPGWPTGPGNPDEALEEAKKAVGRDASYPPNHVALGEALAATGDAEAAKAAYEQAIAAAKASSDPDAPGWIAEAEAAISKL
jgi:tetratricopeptide (TPR) repeat protein